MKKIIISLIFCLSTVVFSATGSSKNQPSSDTSTEHNFEDMLVQGKFHFSDEAVTTVEEDKVLDSLIGVRKDFKDRILMSTTQY
jgi:hypothetical protein